MMTVVQSVKFKDSLSERGRAEHRNEFEIGIEMGLGRGPERPKKSLERAWVVFLLIFAIPGDFWDAFGPQKRIPRAALEAPRKPPCHFSYGIYIGFWSF